jgi:hypothetical protein
MEDRNIHPNLDPNQMRELINNQNYEQGAFDYGFNRKRTKLLEFDEAPIENDVYDPMSMFGSSDVQEDGIKRFKVSENDEFEVDSNNAIVPQTIPIMFELDDSNSVKLKKGNLVVRKYKEGHDELNELQYTHGYEVKQFNYLKKNVQYYPDHALEAVKFFQKNAEPSAPALTIDQVQQIQKDLASTNIEEQKVSTLSMEQQRKDGFNKDKKRVLEKLQQVSRYFSHF